MVTSLESKVLSQILPDELAQLIAQYRDGLVVYARQWVAMAEDCVQEAFIELATVPRPANPTAWLFKVTRNKAMNASRSQVRRTLHERKAGELQVESSYHVDSSLVDLEDQQRLMKALDDLDMPIRELVVLRVWGELTWSQIGELTCMPSSTAQRKYATAILKLKSLLHPAAIDHE